MNVYRCVLVLASMWRLSLAGVYANDGQATEARPTLPVKLVQKALHIDSDAINLQYQIENCSGQDVWICESMDIDAGVDFEVFASDDDGTLLVRRRLDLPMTTYRNPPQGRFIRVRSGESRAEVLSLTVPVWPRLNLSKPQTTGLIESMSRLILEIDYYQGDLLETILGLINHGDPDYTYSDEFRLSLGSRFGTPMFFNLESESLRHRESELRVDHPWCEFIDMEVLRLTADLTEVPYLDEERSRQPRPDLQPCMLMEADFRPSALEFFFPYPEEQSLLGPSEIEELRVTRHVEVRKREVLDALVRELAAGRGGGFLVGGARATLTLHAEDGPVKILVLDNDRSLVDETGQVFRNSILHTLSLPALRFASPLIRGLSQRVQCARNLRNLWHRMRLFNLGAEKAWKPGASPIGIVYPPPSRWCDAIVGQYIGSNEEVVLRPFVCPSAGAGQCHYAMNPYCEPNAPDDTVLLFETKAGWNQHGGPELFTFDNHDPKGGCVLLSDGTVKFIRTEEELAQLRWKP